MGRTTKPSFRKALVERYGTKCYVCGEEGAEYHHLIPLWMGGEDCIENMIPLCHWHHMLMHKATTVSPNRKGAGRKKKPAPDGYESVLDAYFLCRISTSECKAALGLRDKQHLADMYWFNDYIRDRGIRDYRNNIDIIRSTYKRRGTVHDGIVGWVEYKDGTKQEFLHDMVLGI